MNATSGAVIALVLMALLLAPIVAASNADNGVYANKYVATPKSEGTQTGIIQGHLNIGSIGLTNGLMVVGPNGAKYFPELTQYGYFELNNLTPGVYYIYITHGNGGQAESSKVTVGAGQISYPENMLIGYGISDPGQNVVVPKHIEKATYGAQKVVIDQAYVPATHDTYVDVGQWHGDYKKLGQNYVYVGHNNGKYDKIAGHAAIPEISHIDGDFVDVTSEVQFVANMHINSFVFNNAMNPGGIVNSAQNTVLKTIVDPSPGQIKSVHIVYDGGVIDAAEYAIITL
jgi:hypothetical protein